MKTFWRRSESTFSQRTDSAAGAISTDLCSCGVEQHSLQTWRRVQCAAAGSWHVLKSVTAHQDRSVISSICGDFLLEKLLEQSQFSGCQHLVILSASLQHVTLRAHLTTYIPQPNKPVWSCQSFSRCTTTPCHHCEILWLLFTAGISQN